MFSFVPHSLPLSHLGSSLCGGKLHIEGGSTNSKTSECFDNTSDSSTNEQPTRHRGLPLHDSNINTEPPLAVADLEHSPPITRRGADSDHSGLHLHNNHTSDSMPGSISASESINSTQCESVDSTVYQSPNMLSPARLSSFQFVEFTALHETNVIHRLPTSGSLLSVPLNESSMPHISPSTQRKTSTRSRRRCIFCGGLIQFGE